jgi:hypothetical protein
LGARHQHLCGAASDATTTAFIDAALPVDGDHPHLPEAQKHQRHGLARPLGIELVLRAKAAVQHGHHLTALPGFDRILHPLHGGFQRGLWIVGLATGQQPQRRARQPGAARPRRGRAHPLFQVPPHDWQPAWRQALPLAWARPATIGVVARTRVWRSSIQSTPDGKARTIAQVGERLVSCLAKAGDGSAYL